ncbi:ogr/Delta-like zinc finger family protein [Pseudomonas sp. 1D4]|uniref:ogr/Delta-like zinc finger family protein n=1 Tax=Pseudomonas sp. 1D4 TaxID=1843691 RepID=UPI0009F6597D|nr:ogr/Delta-like zinc finger family protein [Pseudomonas sp. 1D4]
MRIYCTQCRGKARIASRDEVSPAFTRLYCQCLDASDCGHRFVMQLTFSHSLVPISGVVDRMLFDRLREMPSQQRRELLEQLESSSV